MSIHQHPDDSPHDARAIEILAAVETHILSLGPPLHPVVRRSNAIRRAIEMHIEHPEPPAPVEVVDLLSRALIAGLRSPGKARPIEDLVRQLREHLHARATGNTT
jgi:hypothetical protein